MSNVLYLVSNVKRNHTLPGTAAVQAVLAVGNYFGSSGHILGGFCIAGYDGPYFWQQACIVGAAGGVSDFVCSRLTLLFLPHVAYHRSVARRASGAVLALSFAACKDTAALDSGV